jgi:hypothetical protein
VSDGYPTSNGDGEGAVGWLVAALIVVAIVGLVLFARGPVDQERSGASLPLAAMITA